MMRSPSTFFADAVGKPLDGEAVVVHKERTVDFSKAIDDHDQSHLSGRLVTPMFNVVPIYSCLFPAVDLVTPEHLRHKIVHGEHDIRFINPIRAGSTLAARAEVTGIHAVRAGTAVTVRIVVSDDNGVVTSEHWATAIVRGEHAAHDTGHVAPAVDLGHQRLDTPELSAQTELDADWPRRFADAAGDINAVHVDDYAARAVGFDGVIMHGLCTMGIVGSTAIRIACAAQPSRLVRLAVRFAAPAYPRGVLTTAVRPIGVGRHELEAKADDGVVVIRRALAEVRVDSR
jgi:acyl dehydratase